MFAAGLKVLEIEAPRMCVLYSVYIYLIMYVMCLRVVNLSAHANDSIRSDSIGVGQSGSSAECLGSVTLST